MEAIPQEVIIYKSPGGRSYFQEWFDTLDDVTADAIMQRLDRIQQGNFGDFKPYENIFELRIHYGSGYRVYFGKDGRKLVVILAGSDKKDQKRVAKKAIELWEDYLKTE